MLKKKLMAVALSCALVVGLNPGVALAANESSDAGLAAGQMESLLVVQGKDRLAKGAVFKHDGSTYKVTRAASGERYSAGYEVGELQLMKYGGTAKKIGYNNELWAPSFSDDRYLVASIGANAFNNKQGKKVTSLRVGGIVHKIGKGAFKNMVALKELHLALFFFLHAYKDSAYKDIAKGAFDNTGKNKGKSLNVCCGTLDGEKPNSSEKKYMAECKKQLVSKGLAESSKISMDLLLG